MSKERIDTLLVQRELASDIDEARRLIMAGLAIADDKRIDKAGDKVDINAEIRLKKRVEYASRGGYKLQKAVNVFSLDMTDCSVIDIGSSTGGFTDVALLSGASVVYAIDVGYNLIIDRLRRDHRVRLLENTNFRTITFDAVGEKVDYIVSDVSFISLMYIIPSTTQFMKEGGKFIVLIKPQYEADRDEVETGGIVSDKEIHLRVCCEIVAFARDYDYVLQGFTVSPIMGAKGNMEYLAYFTYDTQSVEEINYDLIESEIKW